MNWYHIHGQRIVCRPAGLHAICKYRLFRMISMREHFVHCGQQRIVCRLKFYLTSKLVVSYQAVILEFVFIYRVQVW